MAILLDEATATGNAPVETAVLAEQEVSTVETFVQGCPNSKNLEVITELYGTSGTLTATLDVYVYSAEVGWVLVDSLNLSSTQTTAVSGARKSHPINVEGFTHIAIQVGAISGTGPKVSAWAQPGPIGSGGGGGSGGVGTDVNVEEIGGQDVDLGAGNVASGTQRVTIADNDTNQAAIKTAVEKIDDPVGTVGSAVPSSAFLVGGAIESTVPTEEDDGDLAPVWLDTFRRQVIAGYDQGNDAIQTVPVVEAARGTQETVMTVLTTATPTAAVNVENYQDHSIHFTVAGFDTSMSLNVQASLDGSTYVPLSVDGNPDNVVALCAIAAEVITITGNGDFIIRVRGAFHSLKLDLVAFGAGTPTITPTYRGGR